MLVYSVLFCHTCSIPVANVHNGQEAFKRGRFDEAGALYTAGLERQRRWQATRQEQQQQEHQKAAGPVTENSATAPPPPEPEEGVEEKEEQEGFGDMHLLLNNRSKVLVKLGRIQVRCY